MAYQPIENYGVIGDMRTMALAGVDGSIDFFCAPDFDSPAVFSALLDDEKGGCFKFIPDLPGMRCSQLYVPDSNVLITRFIADAGFLEVTDFMTIGQCDEPSRIVRILRVIHGEVRVRVSCRPAFNYARTIHKLNIGNDRKNCLFSSQNLSLRLYATVALEDDGDAVAADVLIKSGEAVSFLLANAEDEVRSFDNERASKWEHETIVYWRDWVSKITYHGRWRDIVNRSALALKLLTSRRYGSIIAAPTFALPEVIGGKRNWDYRYCWIRDSAFTVYAFIHLGLRDEALQFMQWVEKIYKDTQDQSGELQLMYSIDGGSCRGEQELDYFKGYCNSRPVRIGNDAHEEYQLDLYGELMDAIFLADQHVTKISHTAWQDIVQSANYVCDNWKKPDASIWEFRGIRREFLHSRLMCWVALDRILRLAREESLPADTLRWLNTRAEIYDDIFNNFWNEDLQCFVQCKGSTAIDASVLLMPLVDFIGARDPQWLSTLDAVEKHLSLGVMLRRYLPQEVDFATLDGEEGTFSACSFWHIACLARAGQKDKAWLYFSKMLSYANPLGLYAEEIGKGGRQLGNFPQAFTHLALINAVFALEESEKTERSTSG